MLTTQQLHNLDQVAQTLFNNKQYSSAAKVCDFGADYCNDDLKQYFLKNSAMCHYHAEEFDVMIEQLLRYNEFNQAIDVDANRDIAYGYRWLGQYDKMERFVQENTLDVGNKALALGWLEMRRGNFKKSFALTEEGRKGNYWVASRKQPKGQVWRGESLQDKTVLVVAESGAGDEVIFSRWLTNLKQLAKQVYYYTDSSMLDLVCRSLEVQPCRDPNEVSYDYFVPVMSLPYLLGIEEPGNAAYLTVNPVSDKIWQIQGEKKILVHWSGEENHIENKFRRLPEQRLFETARNHGKVFALQLGHKVRIPDYVTDFSPMVRTWDDTAAIVSKMDVVITCCTSLAHLAGALGKKTIVLVNMSNYFTWCDVRSGGKSRWYPDVTVIRQNKIKDWDKPFQDLHNTLCSIF